MPEDDVSDLRDVVDAINRLCETMKTSTYEDADDDDPPGDVPANALESHVVVSPALAPAVADEVLVECVEYRDIELASPEDVVVRKVEVYDAERWSDSTSLVSPPGQADDAETIASDTEPVVAQYEPVSEMYYTASSEVSLLSDAEPPERAREDERDARDDRKECVIAGHVAAMRERFESMTRTNTPCPDLIRSLSPSLEVFRNASPSPDRLA